VETFSRLYLKVQGKRKPDLASNMSNTKTQYYHTPYGIVKGDNKL